jgi:hypothetical protein
VSLEWVHHIVTMEFGMSRVCMRWVHCDLRDEHKRKCVEVCQQNVTSITVLLMSKTPTFYHPLSPVMSLE